MKTRRFGIAILAIVASIVLARWLSNDSERLLDKVSTRLLPSPVRTARFVTHRDAWVSDHELLEVETRLSDRGIRAIRKFDLQRRGSSDMPAFHLAVLRDAKGYWPIVSPDGKWAICWVVELGFRRKEHLCAISLDGKRVVRWPDVDGGIRDYRGHGWMPDSRRYAIVFADRIVMYDREAPGASERIAVPKLDPNCRLIGLVRDGALLTDGGRPGQASTLTRVAMQGKNATVKKWNVDLPRAAWVRGVAVSREGDRLAWCLTFDDEPALAWMKWLRGVLGIQLHPRQGYWVSRLDGTGFREIGHVHDNDLQAPQWVPRGRRLAFNRHGYLYTVPSE